jgi:hypothetical protein
MWMLALMLAAAVGGFAYAEYRSQQSRSDARALREELQTQMRAIAASTARLEQLRFVSAGPATDVPSGAAGSTASSVSATVALPVCKGNIVGFATERGPCAEQDAIKVAVCAPVPAEARVTGLDLFSRIEDSLQPWDQARQTLGQESESGRFVDAHFERPDTDSTRLVCQTFAHWNSGKGRSVRIIVRYAAA